MVEGDLFVEEWRKRMQDTFGGHGVGWVPIISVVENFRMTIQVKHSDDWKHLSILNKGGASALGVGGEAFVPQEGSWVKYMAVNRPHLDYFEEAYLLIYSPQGDASLNVAVGDSTLYIPVSANSKLQKVKLFAGLHTKQTTLNFKKVSPGTVVYGVSFESKNGVFIDNMGLRGSSGIFLGNIQPESLNNDWATQHPYDVIILEYGLNVMKGGVNNYKWFTTSFDKIIKRLKVIYPEASIVLLSVGDRSERVNGGYQTMSVLNHFIQLQQQMAIDNNIHFWSIYDAMGGAGSMLEAGAF
jgi:hypothetical protein